VRTLTLLSDLYHVYPAFVATDLPLCAKRLSTNPLQPRLSAQEVTCICACRAPHGSVWQCPTGTCALNSSNMGCFKHEV